MLEQDEKSLVFNAEARDKAQEIVKNRERPVVEEQFAGRFNIQFLGPGDYGRLDVQQNLIPIPTMKDLSELAGQDNCTNSDYMTAVVKHLPEDHTFDF